MIRGLMKRILIFCLLAVACGREETPTTTSQAPAPAPVRVPAATASMPPRSNVTYAKAVDLFRTSSALHFDLILGNVKTSGDLVRPKAGQERLRFRADRDEWIAVRRFTGVTWYRNGKRDANEPAYADQVYQWMTFFSDPEKSPPQVVGTETVNGEECSHIRFTNLNTKETDDVWIRAADNQLVRLKTSGSGKAFPPVDLTVSHPSGTITIEEPKR
jgi:hypothetical protein